MRYVPHRKGQGKARQGKGKGKGNTFETDLSISSPTPIVSSPLKVVRQHTIWAVRCRPTADYGSVGARQEKGCRQSGLDGEDDSNVRGSHKWSKKARPKVTLARFASSNWLPRL